MSKFAPIHVVSGYSLLRSALTMKRIDYALKSNDYFGMGLTDEWVLNGLPHFVHLLNDQKKPYVLGMSIICEEEELVLYIVNDKGYQNLIDISLTHQKDDVTFEYLKSHSEGLIGVIETNRGHFKEVFSSFDKPDVSFCKYLANISSIFKDGFYLGIEVTNKQEVNYANRIRHFADEYTYECVALPRIRYLKKEDAIAIDILKAIQVNEVLAEKKKVGQEYFLKESDYHKIYTEKEILNTNKIILSSRFELINNRGAMLRYNCEDSAVELEKHAKSRLKELNLENNEQYLSRLNYELSVILKMGYSDYFLLVEDYVNWAKNNDILVAPGRGSSAGSLIAYLLNITEIDPLKYDLQFERFLNPNRSTMPDIDVDFMDNRRDEVIQYVRDKYGKERLANIVSFQTFGAKQALRDIGRVFKISDLHISLLLKPIKKDNDISLGQAYKNVEEFKKLVDSDEYFKEIVSLAGKIEGLPRQSSLHAAGVVLNDVDIARAMPVTIDLNDNYVTQYEFNVLEEQGFLKMDFLGIRNLTTVHRCLELIKNNHPDFSLTLSTIPFDTPEIFELINNGHNIGLFQIETLAMKRGIQIIKPSCFDDVVALLALNRPGPMEFLSTYAKRKDKLEPVKYISNDLKDILESTYGIIVYQEQINQIATKVAGMTPGEADLFRRAISKKNKEIIASNKEIFIKGCLNNGYDEKTASMIFNHIAKFADYGFNKSHSVAYATLTCKMAYLKANYPLEFYSAILQIGTSSETKFGEYISEMKRRNIKVLPPSINSSSLLFDVRKEGLLFPLTSIHGLNILMSKNIIEERNKGPFTDFFNFVNRLYPYKINEGQILSLINSGALDELYSSRSSMRATVKSALQYSELSYSDDGQMNLGISSIAPPSMIIEEDRPIDNLNLEYETLGIMLSSNPLEYKKDKLKELDIEPINETSHYGVHTIAGLVKNVKIITTKKRENMAIVSIYDETDEVEVTVFPRVFEVSKGLLIKNNILLFKGRFENRGEQLTFFADEINRLED